MALALIWAFAALLYAAFYSWYVGFRRRLSADEVERCCQVLREVWPEERVAPVQVFLGQDTGREFYMINLLQLRSRTAGGERGSAVMQRYEKPFLKAIFKRACHPIAVGIAASSALECWGVDHADRWHVAAFVRYRSRRDLAEILLTPRFQEIHVFKEDAVEKTIALAGDSAFIVGGGPKLTVLLVLALLADLLSVVLR